MAEQQHIQLTLSMEEARLLAAMTTAFMAKMADDTEQETAALMLVLMHSDALPALGTTMQSLVEVIRASMVEELSRG